MGVTVKQMFGLMLFFVTCLLALYVVFILSQELSLHLRDAVKALVTAMIGGAAAAVFLNIIEFHNTRNE